MSKFAEQKHWQNWLPKDLSLSLSDSPSSESLLLTNHNEKSLQEEINVIRIQAEKQGFEHGQQKGYQHGFDKGYIDGFNQGLKVAQDEQRYITTQISDLLHELNIISAEIDMIMPERLMQIALIAAGKIIGQSPICDNSIIIGNIQKMLNNQLLLKDNLKIYVHPKDLPSIQRHLGETIERYGWRLLDDRQILRGGYRIVALDREIDATIETRWQQLCQILKEEYQCDYANQTLD